MLAAALLGLAALGGVAPVQAAGAAGAAGHVARGDFDPVLTPEPGGAGGIAGVAITKTFHGDLSGTSVGWMLAVRTADPGSAGYVAMERVTGMLGGRSGGFALQHSGTMDHGARSLAVTIVPGSGADGLAGIAGAMTIDILPSGAHRYVLRYTLPGD